LRELRFVNATASRRRFIGLAFSWLALLGVARAADGPQRREWTVGGVAREGLVYVPAAARAKAAPVVFAFHGHGGSMQNAARSFAYHTLWPEAVVVYLQGLNTPGRLTDSEGKKPGWQHGVADQGGRDLKFFDAVLADLRRELKIDDKRIYATGHSNGGGFTYLLWATRGDTFAAVAPSGAAANALTQKLKPKPAMHIAGEKDPLVKFEWQEQTIGAVLRLNECGAGQPWEHGGKWHDSKVRAPTVIWTHAGGHEFPAAARPAILKFFQSQVRP
jgi:polyhydroxybutyrate depolymerase